jgi:hypothetical protein
MTASNQIFLVMDAGNPKAAFTAGTSGKARLDAFSNPLVYTFWDNQGNVDSEPSHGTERRIEDSARPRPKWLSTYRTSTWDRAAE